MLDFSGLCAAHWFCMMKLTVSYSSLFALFLLLLIGATLLWYDQHFHHYEQEIQRAIAARTLAVTQHELRSHTQLLQAQARAFVLEQTTLLQQLSQRPAPAPLRERLHAALRARFPTMQAAVLATPQGKPLLTVQSSAMPEKPCQTSLDDYVRNGRPSPLRLHGASTAQYGHFDLIVPWLGSAAAPVQTNQAGDAGLLLLNFPASELHHSLRQGEWGGYLIVLQQTTSAQTIETSSLDLATLVTLKNPQGRPLFTQHDQALQLDAAACKVLAKLPVPDTTWELVALAWQGADNTFAKHLLAQVHVNTLLIYSGFLLFTLLMLGLMRRTETARQHSEQRLYDSHQRLREQSNILQHSYEDIMRYNAELHHSNAEKDQYAQRLRQNLAELAAAKQELEAAHRVKNEFLASISHEIRTPVHGIVGFSQLLKQDANLNPRQQDALRVIESSAQQLLVLFNDLIELSRLSTRAAPMLNEIAWLPFLHTLIEPIQTRAAEKQLKFSFVALSPLPSLVRVDDKRLGQILLNLLGNAIKFTERGELTFQMEYRDGWARFLVHDTGVGIAAEHLEKIFQPFQQLGKEGYITQGAGVGLSVSQRFVETLGGKLQVKSQLGKGSVFWFQIPLEDLSPPQDQQENANHWVLQGYQGRRRKLLLLVPNPSRQALLDELLSPLGFELRHLDQQAADPFEKLTHWHPDLVLVDLDHSAGLLPLVEQLHLFRTMQHTIFIAFSDADHRASGFHDQLPFSAVSQQLFECLGKHLRLTWHYRFHDTQQVAPPLAPAMQAGPAPEIARQIYELASQGDIDALQILVNSLIAQASTETLPFFQELLRLTNDCQVRRVRDLAKPYLKSAA